ncbi:MAG: hypothetical protein WBZ36_02270 [Candidatus Nitrosopolaris sp.]
MRIVFDDKRQRQQKLQLIDQRMKELEEKEQQLEARETKLIEKLNEIEPLIPSVRKLQSVGITFDLIMPYILIINEW